MVAGHGVYGGQVRTPFRPRPELRVYKRLYIKENKTDSNRMACFRMLVKKSKLSRIENSIAFYVFFFVKPT